jgi:hypothetical protein
MKLRELLLRVALADQEQIDLVRTRSVYNREEEGVMPATSEELMTIARAAADKIDIRTEVRQFPSFGDVEEQCESEFDELLETLHDDDVFESVDVQRQQDIAESLTASLPQEKRDLLDELIDNQARQLWLNQEAAFHLGMAVGMRLAAGRRQ